MRRVLASLADPQKVGGDPLTAGRCNGCSRNTASPVWCCLGRSAASRGWCGTAAATRVSGRSGRCSAAGRCSAWNDPTAAGRDAQLRLEARPGPAGVRSRTPSRCRRGTEFPEPAVRRSGSSSAPARCWPDRGAGGGYLPGPARRRPAAGRRAGATALVRHRRARVEARRWRRARPRSTRRGWRGRCASTPPGSSRRGPGALPEVQGALVLGVRSAGGRSWPTRTTRRLPRPGQRLPGAVRTRSGVTRGRRCCGCSRSRPCTRCWLACRWPRPGPADRGPGPAGARAVAQPLPAARIQGQQPPVLRPDLALEEMRVVVVRLLPWRWRDSRPSRCRPR